MTTLPPSASDQVFVEVSALNGGFVTLPEKLFVTDADPNLKKTVPSMCFLIRHRSKSGKTDRIVFDLGIKRELTQYAQGMRDHLSKRQPITTSPDTAESLRKGNLDPATDITHVILSHTHWDHIGMPSDYPNAQFIVGSGTLHTIVHGANHYPASMFEKDPLPFDRTKELPPTANSPCADIAAPTTHQTTHTWRPISTLPNATDLFGDGSIYLIDAPGHLQGHLNSSRA
ncbi:uncharacterized protein AB675_9195 [Cyphellophora attinorum]|uniref:Uncharacterized protein n=1 Tax=Cyphellophora attinorum TaxID=1664694 RepID=A0A0N1HW02_9EURO|nr:uncharacterized protein AB675_9195 [Phialophora attinorum]KPI41632.1 hypothetical protein AB675_9195 [Phialophora attinorum]